MGRSSGARWFLLASAQVDGHWVGRAGCQEQLCARQAAQVMGLSGESQRGVLGRTVDHSIRVMAEEQTGVIAVRKRKQIAVGCM